MTKKAETPQYPDQAVIPEHYDLPEIMTIDELPEGVRVRISRDKLILSHDADKRIWIHREIKVNLTGINPWKEAISSAELLGSNAYLHKSGDYICIDSKYINFREIVPIAPDDSTDLFLPVKIDQALDVTK